MFEPIELSWDEDPADRVTVRRRRESPRREWLLRFGAFICCLGLVSGYAAARYDAFSAQAGLHLHQTERNTLAPGYIMILEGNGESSTEQPEAAAPPPVGERSNAGNRLGERTTWRAPLEAVEDEEVVTELDFATMQELGTLSLEELSGPWEAEEGVKEGSEVTIEAPLQPVKTPVAGRSQANEGGAEQRAGDAIPPALSVASCHQGVNPPAMPNQPDLLAASFVVVGSYTDPMNALKAYSMVEDRWHATIVHVEVSGRLYRRVLIGPFAVDSVVRVQKSLDEQGLIGSWALRATCRAES